MNRPRWRVGLWTQGLRPEAIYILRLHPHADVRFQLGFVTEADDRALLIAAEGVLLVSLLSRRWRVVESLLLVGCLRALRAAEGLRRRWLLGAAEAAPVCRLLPAVEGRRRLCERVLVRAVRGRS